MTPIEWLDHTADIGFRATGPSLENAFCEAARAIFSFMFAIDSIVASTSHDVDVRASSLEGLLADWLSDLLAQKDLSGSVFSRFELTIAGSDAEGYQAKGRAWGERLDRVKHQAGTEIKGISYLGLSVDCDQSQCMTQVIVDV